jgi:hypothetical protein
MVFWPEASFTVIKTMLHIMAKVSFPFCCREDFANT